MRLINNITTALTAPAADLFFIKKERVYTKLKYSRVPQYDIISGGFAALLAALFGFLVCEKFGFEMVDSGDFFYVFIYLAALTYVVQTWARHLFSKSAAPLGHPI